MNIPISKGGIRMCGLLSMNFPNNFADIPSGKQLHHMIDIDDRITKMYAEIYVSLCLCCCASHHLSLCHCYYNIFVAAFVETQIK
jgi:hypothetical protein